ncbi:DNA polymerase III subunit gamma/tau [Kordiimonas pumila]|uniref:DNA polymerase III subunit gamma/tau n=1 Tax=Kordiimonas pumila TaxID=2161677 RepID=A0ABV7D077_9PROT|nr:DNA polymerase III subunit gamma/tau [Kordiimonas pumila]
MANTGENQEYRVLARKYRPADFDTLIGQEAMVRTLSNAIDSGRLAHAFIMTGVRGVGKTTTARIIAKALNCTAHDGPTINPCGVCNNCRSIAESRHVDVLEMDAASRTGVDDIREIIESVRYAPVSARYKIYIIDEVHMLSKNAFNALLKTLEEPPEHVKFIFATTEIRKLPVTVLSRCQRFDLKRVDASVLVTHLATLVEKEGSKAEDGALKLIARAAEGSVRDSLSLLDQAIAHGAGDVTEAQVRDMLGLADRAQVLDLFELLMKGDIAPALDTLRAQYDSGADPAVILSDLLEVSHWLTRLKVTPDSGADTLVSEAEKTLGSKMAETLSMAHLTRAWQMLLKGLGEVKNAPSPIAAAEMVLIRLAYAANLPSPADLVKQLQDNGGAGAPAGGGTPRGGAGGGGTVTAIGRTAPGMQGAPSGASAVQRSADVIALRQDSNISDHAAQPMPVSFEKLVDLFHAMKEPTLAVALKDHVRLVNYRPGFLEINTTRQMRPDFIMQVKNCLKLWTGAEWQITISRSEGEETIRSQEVARDQKRKDEALAEPIVKAFLSYFPDAEMLAVRDSRSDDPDMVEIPAGAEDADLDYSDDAPSEMGDFDF